jgi:CBS domain-containing protein
MTDRPVHVRDVLDPDLAESLKPGDTLGDVLENIVGRFRLNSIPVVESDRLVGVLRVGKLLASFHGQEGEKTTRRAVLKNLTANEVSDLMEAAPARLGPGDTLNRAAEVMLTTGWHEIPVTDQKRKFEGVLTARDLVRVQLRRIIGET